MKKLLLLFVSMVILASCGPNPRLKPEADKPVLTLGEGTCVDTTEGRVCGQVVKSEPNCFYFSTEASPSCSSTEVMVVFVCPSRAKRSEQNALVIP